MKNIFLKLLFLVFAFALITSCSIEKEDALEQELVTANLFGDQTIHSICGNDNLETEGYGINIIFVEYKPRLTREEKQAIRAPYCNNMISIEPCDINPNGEIWTVRGPCHNNGPLPLICQPGVLPPADPDLRQSISTSECQYPIFEPFENPNPFGPDN